MGIFFLLTPQLTGRTAELWRHLGAPSPGCQPGGPQPFSLKSGGISQDDNQCGGGAGLAATAVSISTEPRRGSPGNRDEGCQLS